MTVFELSVLSAVGMLVFFAVGFLAGIGYQQVEDSRAMRKKDEQIRFYEREIPVFKEQIKQAKKEISDLEWAQVLKDPMANLFTAEDIKFGDEK